MSGRVRIRAAISPCPNDVFIFSGILLGAVDNDGLEFDFDFQDVETLNAQARGGLADLVKISYANFPHCSRNYALLGCGGALGRACGPLLLTNGQAWNPEVEVLVPGRYTTANFLLDFYAGTALKKTYLPFDEVYRRLQGGAPCQGVVIHELRFRYAADGLRLVRDLGGHWETATGLPIPLGAVAVRKALELACPGISRRLEALIRRSLDWAYAHEAEALALCRRHSQSMADDVLRAHIGLYVNAFTREVGEDGEGAVRVLLERIALAS